MEDKYTISEIKKILAEHSPRKDPPERGYRPASVLVPFYPDENGLSMVFMKRPEELGPHSGQISFPGGRRDPEDKNNLDTALRETEEEIGVDRNDIEVWGRLNQSHTLGSGYWISPFVGQIPYPYEFRPNEIEVERLIIVPFAHLLDPENYSEGTYVWGERSYKTQLYTYGQDVIWGLTARLLYNFLTLLASGREPEYDDLLEGN